MIYVGIRSGANRSFYVVLPFGIITVVQSPKLTDYHLLRGV